MPSGGSASKFQGQEAGGRSVDDLKTEVLAHAVTDAQRAVALYALQGRVDLHDGERDLLAIALSVKTEVWWLCGPDKATIRAMHLLGMIDRMVSLKSLADEVGVKLAQPEEQDTEKWLSEKRTMLLLGGDLI